MPNERNVRASDRREEPLRPGRVLEVAFGGVMLAVVAAAFAMSCGVRRPGLAALRVSPVTLGAESR